jgi:uncharacterized membrane protein YdjX (TVP38/TMEM64 family)
VKLTRKASLVLRIIGGMVLAGFLGGVYVALSQTGILELLHEGEILKGLIERLGLAGPVLIVGLMMVAIVISPIPSAPIALAAGAVYGHYWGTLYVAVGAESGALIAFGLARLLGAGAIQSWLGARPAATLLDRFYHSQNALAAMVFATRLMPFLSFDVISYAAGLTPLKTWRFAVATLLGIIPVSFFLTHFGDTMATGDLRALGVTFLVLGFVTVIPIAWGAAPERYRARLLRLVRIK